MPGPSGIDPRYGLHYPLLGDTPDAEKDIHQLVEDLAKMSLGRAAMLQPGVQEPTDFSWPNTFLEAGTGKLSANSISGQVWLKDAQNTFNDLMWHFSVGLSFAITPPALPANGKYMNILVVISPSKWGGDPTFSLLSGTEQTTKLLAEANPPVVTGNKMAIREVILKNNAGTYAFELDRDRRPWARGGSAFQKVGSGAEVYATTSTSLVAIDNTNLSIRMECSGRPVRLTLGGMYSNSQTGKFDFLMDGSAINQPAIVVPTADMRLDMRAIVTPTAGTHLFRPAWLVSASTLFLQKEINVPVVFGVEEILQSATNGTQ